MLQAIPKLLSFEEFVEWLPEDGRYELHDGVVVEMQPTGKHEDIAAYLAEVFTLEYTRLKHPYRIPPNALVKPPHKETGYTPDVLLLDRRALAFEPLWKRASTVTQGACIPILVEVVSTNWRDDYLTKLADYEVFGVPEYWVVDYAALGGRRFIGNPKQPTISIYILVEGEYQVSQFRGADLIVSSTFPELKLTAEEVLQAGKEEEDELRIINHELG